MLTRAFLVRFSIPKHFIRRPDILCYNPRKVRRLVIYYLYCSTRICVALLESLPRVILRFLYAYKELR